jgi:hypothetical protein
VSLAAGGAFLLLLAAAGWWPSRALLPWLAGGSWAGRLSAALACGAAATGLAQVALGAVGVPAGWLAPSLLAALSLAAGARVRPGAAPEPPLPRVVVLLLLLVALAGAGAAVGTPFRSDGSKFWAPRARELARTAASEAPSLHDPARLAVHRDYPLLVPSLLAPVFAASPPDAMAGPKLVLAGLQLALLGCLATLLRRRGGEGLLLLAAAGTAPLLVSLDVRESAVAGGYADGVVALFLLLVVACVERLRAEGGARTAAGAALLGGALASTKLEGGAELLVVLGAWALCGPRRGLTVATAIGAALLLAPTLLLRAGVAPEEPGFLLQRLADAETLAARGLPVAAGVLRLAGEATCLGLLPVLLLARSARPGQGFARLLLLGLLLLLAVSYLSTSMHAVRHLQTSAHRLAWHWVPALALLAAAPRAGGDRGR